MQISKTEFNQRTQQLLDHVKREQLAGVVLFDNFYILYYTGFAFIPTERPMAFAINANGERVLYVPRLEVEHAKSQARVDRIESYLEYPDNPHPMKQLETILNGLTIKKKIGADNDGYPMILGYHGDSLSTLTGAQIIPVNRFVEHQMMLKSHAELAVIRESVKWGNLAHRLLQKYTRVGANEVEVSQRAGTEATLAMIDALGSQYRSYSIWSRGASAGYRGQIGRNASIPHSLTTNAVFMAGDVLVTGANAPMWGYNSELERTMIIGDASEEQRKFFEHMVNLQDAALNAIKPGKKCSDVNRAVRSYFDKNNLMPYWRHHSGHAIGLRYHEGPFLDSGDDTTLEPGMVFTVEPGLYTPELGGFRHSDTVVVTQDGIDVLTYYPRDLPSLTISV